MEKNKDQNDLKKVKFIPKKSKSLEDHGILRTIVQIHRIISRNMNKTRNRHERMRYLRENKENILKNM